MTPDVNILVAALRNDHTHHAVARAWLEKALLSANKGTPFCLQPMVVASFLRLVTNRKIFMTPTPMTIGLKFIDQLLKVPGVKQVTLGTEWPIFCKLCADKKLSANDVPDAWLAAAVIPIGIYESVLIGFFKIYPSELKILC
jgi:uncharacterized protein